MFQSFVPLRHGRSAVPRAVELHAIGIEDRFVAVRVAGAAPRHPVIQKCKHRYIQKYTYYRYYIDMRYR
jgi:hypothetical protein